MIMSRPTLCACGGRAWGRTERERSQTCFRRVNNLKFINLGTTLPTTERTSSYEPQTQRLNQNHCKPSADQNLSVNQHIQTNNPDLLQFIFKSVKKEQGHVYKSTNVCLSEWQSCLMEVFNLGMKQEPTAQRECDGCRNNVPIPHVAFLHKRHLWIGSGGRNQHFNHRYICSENKYMDTNTD